MADQPFQSLYRRFRPQRFSEVRGQDHVVQALRNVVREGRVGHAYLFSGPRGTGKTSTARILAKALNCTNLQDGEPCCECASCLSVQAGSSMDVQELDAASNNGVDAIRDLVARAALGTPGRWKVYIVDEVHMLSTPASNALLKTLEEPPGHVIFVLATTDPQKVLPTIRSRTQHFEFRLLRGEVLADLVKDVNARADLGVSEAAIDLVVRRGRGSARDALSVLDQVAAAGQAEEEPPSHDEVVEALCERDAGRALIAVAEACAAGRDARRLGEELIEHLRNAFLMAMRAGELVDLPDDARDRLADQAHRLGPAGITRAMETLGQALVDMREALDPRVTLEVALVRAARPDAEVTPAALLERIERLERAGPRPAPPNSVAQGPVSGPPATEKRAALGAVRRAAAPTQPAPTPPPSSPQPAGDIPSRDELTKAWGDTVLKQLSGRARARFSAGRFTAVEGGKATFALPNDVHRGRCEEVRPEAEAALAAHFGAAVPLRLVVDAPHTQAAAPPPADDEVVDLGELRAAPAEAASPVARVKEAFPGAEEITT